MRKSRDVDVVPIDTAVSQMYAVYSICFLDCLCVSVSKWSLLLVIIDVSIVVVLLAAVAENPDPCHQAQSRPT